MAELAPLLSGYGIAVVSSATATTPEEAAAVAERLGLPVALKISSPDIVHKTDVGGVRLGLATTQEVAEATAAMLVRVRAERPGAVVRGVVVQTMAPKGHELLLGAIRDPQFGCLVVVGFGGIYTEVLRDVVARLAPVDPWEARIMLDELRMAPVLRGVRGQPPVDLAGLARTVSRFARLATALPELVELEINPLVASPTGTVAVDARARRSPAEPPSPSGCLPLSRRPPMT
jgi:acetyltransferase